MRSILLAALMLLPTLALGQATGLIINGQATATITWTAPTQYTDNSALPPEDLGGYVVFYHDQSRFEADGTTLRTGCTASPVSSRIDPDCYPNVVDLVDGSSVSQAMTFQLTESKTIYFAMTSWVRTGTAFGDWSEYSAEVTKAFTLEVSDGRVPGGAVIQTIDMSITCTTDKPMVTCTFTVR